MEFDTNSVWVIVIGLLLVTIFIVVWYFYQELLIIKRKSNNGLGDLVERIEKIEAEIENNLSYDEDFSENDEDVEYDEELTDIFKELADELQEQKVQELDCEEITTSCEPQVSDSEAHKEVCEAPETQYEEEVHLNTIEEASEHGDEQEHFVCDKILVSGKRKGEPCGKKCEEGHDKCKKHA